MNLYLDLTLKWRQHVFGHQLAYLTAACIGINLLAPELFFLNFSTPVNKM